MTDTPNIFADFVSSVSHSNGVFRITLSQQVQDQEAQEVARLLIPANQLQGVLRGIAEGANEIREKLQASQGSAETPAEGDG